MKKVCLIFTLLVVFAFSTYADGDIQFGPEVSFGTPAGFGYGFEVTNHNFFAGNDKNLGIGERISLSITVNNNNESWLVKNILVGVDYRIKACEEVAVQFIIGPAYDHGGRMFSGRDLYCLSAGCDAQVKFSANRKCSFVAGLYGQLGASFVKEDLKYVTEFYGSVRPYALFGINW